MTIWDWGDHHWIVTSICVLMLVAGFAGIMQGIGDRIAQRKK